MKLLNLCTTLVVFWATASALDLIRFRTNIPNARPTVIWDNLLVKHTFENRIRFIVYGFRSIKDLEGLTFPFTILNLPPNLTILGEVAQIENVKLPTYLQYRICNAI